MAYTREQARDLIKQRCDLENTSAQTNAEINNHINDAASYVHDFLISTLGERYAITSVNGTTTSGTATYSIGSTLTFNCTDFYRPLRVSLTYDSLSYPLAAYSPIDEILRPTATSWGPSYLPRYTFIFSSTSATHQISFDPPPDTAQTVNIVYHPTAPTYTADSGAGGVIYLPYPDLLITEAAIRMKMKEERDASLLLAERAAIQARIENWVGNVDLGEPWGTLQSKRGGRSRWRRTREF